MCLERSRITDRVEDEYQIPSSHPVCITQPPVCISAPISNRSAENSSDLSSEGKKLKAPEHGEFDVGVSGVVPATQCPLHNNRTPADYDILLPPQALVAEDPFNTAPPSQPPPPPPVRHSFPDASSSSSSSSSPSCPRAARPTSGHFLLNSDPFLDAPLPPVRRQTGDSIFRNSQEYDQLPPTSIPGDCPRAPARPPKPFPRKTPPEILHRRPPEYSQENVDAKIAKLMGEGYSFDDVKRALLIAQNKVDVARNILREFALVAPRLNL